MAESFQQRRKRQRPARVNLTYDVETGGAMQKVEIPFVMGVMSDLSGDGADQLDDLADRQFVEIKPDNFDKVLRGMKPKLQFTVDNKLDPEANDKIGVELEFESFEDFSPERIAERVAPLAKILEQRQALSDLKGKLATNRKLNKSLQSALDQVMEDDDARAKLQAELDEIGGDEDGGS